jgi:hypothetical protein
VPPAFVRSYGFNRMTGNTSTATLGSLEFDLNDVAVITLAWYNVMTDAITVADSNGNTWAKVTNTFQQITGGANPPGQQLWWAIITNPGTGITFTATYPATAYYPATYGCEASGVSEIDQSVSAQGPSGPPQSSGNITTTAAGFLYGSVYDNSGNTTALVGGGTWVGVIDAYDYYINAYQIASSSGTFAATGTTGTGSFAAAIVAFMSPTPPPPATRAVVVCIMQ